MNLDHITERLSNHTHLMVDIETWSTEPDAVIVELSAVLFTLEDGIG